MQWTTPEEVGRMRFSPSGLLLATTLRSEEEGPEVLYLWDALRGTEVARLDLPTPVWSLAFVGERELLVVEEHRCLLWDAASGAARTFWDGYNAPAWQGARRFTSGTASADGSFVALCLESTVVVLDSPSGTVRHRLRTPRDTEVWYEDLVAVGPYLAGLCRASRNAFTYAVLWDAARGRRLRTYDLSEYGEPSPLALRPDGAGLAVGTHDAILAYGLENEEVLDGFTPFQTGEGVVEMRYSADSRALEAVLYRQNRLVRLDAATGTVLTNQKLATSLQRPFAALDPNGEKVALAQDRTIEVLDLADTP